MAGVIYHGKQVIFIYEMARGRCFGSYVTCALLNKAIRAAHVIDRL